jgi:hypothetical protein
MLVGPVVDTAINSLQDIFSDSSNQSPTPVVTTEDSVNQEPSVAK